VQGRHTQKRQINEVPTGLKKLPGSPEKGEEDPNTDAPPRYDDTNVSDIMNDSFDPGT
jgi:hypothetical protein